jgi:hypothetical protein
MTCRAVIIGLVGAWFIAGFGYVNDWVLDLERFTAGRLLPVVVLGPMLLAVVLINPLLFRLRRSWALRPAEIGLIVVLTTAACSLCGGGFADHFLQTLVLPHHWARITPGWKERDLLAYAPPQALVDPRGQENALNQFVVGADRVGRGRESLGERARRLWRQVPWASWRQPLLVWLPMVFLAALVSVSLALVVHRQWSEHEHLAYPIADFTTALVETREGQALGQVFHERTFWLGFGTVFLVRVNNGLCEWFPDVLVPVQLTFSFAALSRLFPWVMDVPLAGYSLLVVTVYPLAVAFAFFVSSEISLTLGLTQVLWALAAAPMVKAGIDLSTDYGLGGWSAWQRVGSYTAFTLMLAYAGRHYYGAVLAEALCLRRPRAPDDGAVWACRLALVSAAALLVLMVRLGLELPYALGTLGLLLMSFVVVSRISAETGLFFIHARWQPFAALLAMCGGYAIGIHSVVISGLVCMILCFDHSQFLMAYLSNGLKIASRLGLGLGRVSRLSFAMYVVGAGLALVIALCATYEDGTPRECGFSYYQTPMMPFQAADSALLRLRATGQLEEVLERPWYQRLGGLRPTPSFAWAASLGFLCVGLFSILRLRVPWWPLHPVLFLVWATWPAVLLWSSFLVGWLIKMVSLRFGGFGLVRRLRPLMVGVIAAEIAAAISFMLAGALYFAITGNKPIYYQFFPR